MEFYERNLDRLSEDYARDRKEATEASGSVPILYLKKGITVVRVMPAFNEEGVWYREYMEHGVKINGRYATVTCARPDAACPLCEEGEMLHNSGDEAKVLAAEELKPRRQYLFNVIPISTPDGITADKGVHVMKAGKMVRTQLLDLDMDSACCGDITSIDNGVNIRIERRGDGKFGTEYTVRNVRDRTDIAAELASQGVDINKFQLFNLFDVFPPKEYEEAKKLVGNVHAVPGFPVDASPRPMKARPFPMLPPNEETEAPEVKQEPRVNSAPVMPAPVLKPISTPRPLTSLPNRPRLVKPTAAPVLPDPPQE